MFEQLKKQLNEIASNWNGDDSGIAEERAELANDAIELIEQLRGILYLLNIK